MKLVLTLAAVSLCAGLAMSALADPTAMSDATTGTTVSTTGTAGNATAGTTVGTSTETMGDTSTTTATTAGKTDTMTEEQCKITREHCAKGIIAAQKCEALLKDCKDSKVDDIVAKNKSEN